MKYNFYFFCISFFLQLTLNAQEIKQTNCFYDNSPVYSLNLNEISVEGEVANPGLVNYYNLISHSVIVKESFLDKDGKISFVGAYKYSGYSLKEILDPFILKKKNGNDFPPEVDLYVEISNDLGDKVVLSWGEIFYPNKLNQIIIASSVMPIIPEKTEENWPIPAFSKLVVSNDLITIRNINNPSKISVRSAVVEASIEKGGKLVDAEEFTIIINGQMIDKINKIPENCKVMSLHTIFYGKGRGLHSTVAFHFSRKVR